MMQQFPSVVLEATRDSQATPSTLPSGAATPALDLGALNAQLSNLGFRPAHIASALTALSSANARLNSSSTATSDPLVLSLTILSPLEAAIEWLLLHLPEDDLPLRYRTSSSSADFVVGASKKGGLVRGWLADKMVKQAGFPRKGVESVLEKDVTEGEALEIISRRLCGWFGEDEGWGDGAVVPWSGDEQAESDRALAREEEEMAIEAVMGERHSRDEGAIAIEVEDYANGDKITLKVFFDPASPYPSPQYPTRPPAFYLESATVPSYMRLYLHASLLRQFRDTERGDLRSILESGQGGAVLSMVEYLEQALPEVIANPPDVGAVTEHLIPKPEVVERSQDQARRKIVKRSQGPGKRKTVTQRDHDEAVQTQKRMREDSGWTAMLRDREKLPAWKEKDAIVEALEKNRVLVVVGEVSRFLSCSGNTDTRLDAVKGGHGIASKLTASTQLPQFLLDHEIEQNRGGSASIIVTQPRRVAAIGVASRVANERMEDIDKNVGTVGYAIRGERRSGAQTKLLFCTTGVVLRRLGSGDPDLEGVSHVVVDEAHERGVDTDLLICLLRDLLQRNKTIKVRTGLSRCLD